jgi:hypothetical protein
MKKRSVLLVLMIAVVFAFGSCTKDKFVKTNGILTGKVTDASTFSSLGGVIITVEGNSQLTDTTSADGTYSLSGIPAGEYRIIYSIAGYAPQKQVISIVSSGATSRKNDDEDYQVVNDEQMLPLTGIVNGSVLNQNGGVVSNAIVRATVTYNGVLLDTVFVATTNSVGYYSFSGLPFAPRTSVSLFATYTNASGIGSATYSAAAFDVQSANIVVSESQIQYASANFTNGTGNTGFDPSGTPILTFTTTVDVQSTQQYGNLILTNNASGKIVGVTLLQPPSGTVNQLMIAPLAKMADLTSYTISGYVYSSATQKTPYLSLTFTTKSSTVATTTLNLIALPVFSVSSTYLTLTTATPGATGYDIYAQIGSASEFYVVTQPAYPQGYPLTAVAPANPFSIPTATYVSITKFYIVPVGVDSNGKTIRGMPSAIVSR